MDENQIQELLKTIPGSRRSANGVSVINDEFSYHISEITQTDPRLTSSEKFFESFCSVKEIIRLRSIKTPYDYMLKIRADSIVDSPRQVRVFAKRKKEFNKFWSLSQYYHTLNSAPKRYISKLPKSLQKKIKSTPFGFAPMVEANACCYKTVIGEFVLVSEALKHFYYFMTICLYGRSYDIEDRDCLSAGLIALRTIIGTEALDFDIDIRGVLPTKMSAEVRKHVDNMLEFTFGHEFAHLTLSHNHMEIPIGLVGNDECLKTYEHLMEFEADKHAITSVIKPNYRQDLLYGAYNVFLYLRLIEVLSEKYSEIPDFSVSSTHPTPIQRIENLTKLSIGKKPSITDYLTSSNETIEQVAQMLSHIIDNHERDDILSFYGSVYMPGLGGKLRRDHIDF